MFIHYVLHMHEFSLKILIFNLDKFKIIYEDFFDSLYIALIEDRIVLD